MIKCNVTMCGTISRVATVRTTAKNKVFTAFAVSCVVPAKSGINKTVEISVAKDGEDNELKNYCLGTTGKCVGHDFQETWGQPLFQSVSFGLFRLPMKIPSRGKCTSGERLEKSLKRKPTRKARTFTVLRLFRRESPMTASNAPVGTVLWL